MKTLVNPPESIKKKKSWVQWICNSSAGVTDTGGSLDLLVSCSSHTGKFQVQWEIVSKEDGERLKEISEAPFWHPCTDIQNEQEHTHIPKDWNFWLQSMEVARDLRTILLWAQYTRKNWRTKEIRKDEKTRRNGKHVWSLTPRRIRTGDWEFCL